MEAHQWATLGLGVLGFVGTWVFGAFRLGRAVEQMRTGVREEIEEEREKIIAKIDQLETRFDTDQRAQDHNFGEVGAAMRQYIADVEKKLREVEIWGRDNYVQKTEFEKATDRLTDAIKSMGADIKADIRELNAKIDAKH